MSLVYITHHDENVEDIEKNLYFQIAKREAYLSKHVFKVRAPYKRLDVIKLHDGKKLLTDSKKSAHKTMGYDETPLEPPCNYLRKNKGVRWQRKNDHVCPKNVKPMVPVPRWETLKKEHKEMTKSAKVNFIKKNVGLVKAAPAKQRPPRYIDIHTGTPRRLLNSGLLPQYTCSEDYGKVPCYLVKRKQSLRESAKQCEIAKQELLDKCMLENASMRKMSTEERQNILSGLKQQFAKVLKAYLSGSLYTDTIAKQLKAAKLEKELRQLEQDIFLIESNPVVYISDF